MPDILDIDKLYYPFTDQCPKDGRYCLKEQCQQFENGKCYFHELRTLFKTIFESEYSDTYFVHDENSNINYSIDIVSYYGEKEGDVDRTGVNIDFEHHVTEKMVIKELELNNYLSKDKYGYYIAYFPELCENLPKIGKLLKLLKSKEDDILQAIIKHQTCAKCGIPNNYVKYFKNKAICNNCQNIIIENWVETNVK